MQTAEIKFFEIEIELKVILQVVCGDMVFIAAHKTGYVNRLYYRLYVARWFL